MRVLVDTPIWSEFFRRREPNPAINEALKGLIKRGDALLIGPVRQEILCGLRNANQFEMLRVALSPFPNQPIINADYEVAAAMTNQCGAKGVQGAGTDFLLCAISTRLSIPIFTLDKDFLLFGRVLPIQLYESSTGQPWLG